MSNRPWVVLEWSEYDPKSADLIDSNVAAIYGPYHNREAALSAVDDIRRAMPESSLDLEAIQTRDLPIAVKASKAAIEKAAREPKRESALDELRRAEATHLRALAVQAGQTGEVHDRLAILVDRLTDVASMLATVAQGLQTSGKAETPKP